MSNTGGLVEQAGWLRRRAEPHNTIDTTRLSGDTQRPLPGGGPSSGVADCQGRAHGVLLSKGRGFVCACFARRVGRRQFSAGLWLLSHVACCLPPLAVPRLCRVIHVTPPRVNALRIRCAFKCTTPASATRTHMPTAAATQLQSLSMPTNPAKYRTNRLQALPAFNIDSICMRGCGHI